MNNRIEYIRGDTYVVNLFVKNADGTAYIPQDTDIITMTVRAKGDRGPIVIQKTTGDADVAATPEGWIIVLQASDTAELQYISYVYDIQLDMLGGIQTVIPLSKLILKKEVTY